MKKLFILILTLLICFLGYCGDEDCSNPPLAVVAFGGNALRKDGSSGSAEEQMEACYETCKNLVTLIEDGYNLVITHGNGPQVGVKILKEMAGAAEPMNLPKMPMYISGAETQGFIGYMIESQLQKALEERGIEKNIVTIVTRVEVGSDDPAFQNPAKPVGIYYNEEEMKDLKSSNPSWVFKEDAKKKDMYRRVVPSPRPIEIRNWDIVERLAREGNIIISVGGGGIPVVKSSNGFLEGVDAVIDKDLASSVLARKINADEFIIFTDVSNAYVNFRKPDELRLEEVTVEELKNYEKEGHFGAGSMGPKIRAVVEFVESSQTGKAIITNAETVAEGKKGTVISM